jgi:hypothetical protein
MNEREAASVIAILAAAFPQWPASRETVAVYVDALVDLDHQQVREAVRELIFTEERWPSIAAIRRQVAIRSHVLAPTPVDAWAEVTRHSANGGRKSLPAWSDPAISETVTAIGWWNICASSNLETLRAQFLRLYEEVRKRSDATVLSTPGRIALDVKRRDTFLEAGIVADAESEATGHC